MNEKKELKINVGGSSIILMILVFALAVFAVLSIKASNNDLKLAKKTVASVQNFYLADAKAEELLMKLDQCIKESKEKEQITTLKKDLSLVDKSIKIEENDGKLQGLTYEVKMSETAVLRVILTIDLTKESNELYEVQTWKVVQNDIGAYDFTEFEFWDGKIE